MDFSDLQLEVKEIKEKDLGSIISSWENNGATSSDIEEIKLLDDNDRIKLFIVKNRQDILAIFDLRDAIRHVKNMKVFFNPSLRINDDVTTYEDYEKKIFFTVNILSEIFLYVVRLSGQWATVKIYNDSPYEKTIFGFLAKELKEKNNHYQIKLYRSWIEITNIDEI